MHEFATSTNTPPEGGIFLPEHFVDPSDIYHLSTFYWQHYKDRLPKHKVGQMLSGGLLAEDLPPDYQPSYEVTRLTELKTSVAFDARFHECGEFAWEITLADEHGNRDEFYLSTLMCASSFARFDTQGVKRHSRYLDASEIAVYTGWLGRLLIGDTAQEYLDEVKDAILPKALPRNKPITKLPHKEPPALPACKELMPQVDRTEFLYKPAKHIDIKFVFKLIENLRTIEHKSDYAKKMLAEFSTDDLKPMHNMLHHLRETGPWLEMRGERGWELFVEIEQLKEQANMFDDAAATIRQAGECLVELLLARLQLGAHKFAGHNYLVYQDRWKRRWLYGFDGERLILFNKWDAIPAGEEKAAQLSDCVKLLVDTQLEVVYGTGTSFC